jgi:hypothetical protein
LAEAGKGRDFPAGRPLSLRGLAGGVA